MGSSVILWSLTYSITGEGPFRAFIRLVTGPGVVPHHRPPVSSWA